MEQITLNMIPNGYTPTAHISQYDNGRHIRFNLQNINLAGNETVTLKIGKTNGELVTKTIENHTNYVEYVSEKADCDVSGKANCEIVISKNDVVIGSKNFILNIEADPYDNAGVVTETASGRIATFETNMVDVLQSVKCNILATGGNGTPDNPNPINGYTEAKITRCGVNLWNEEWELGTIDNSGADTPTSLLFRSKGYIKVEPNKIYYCYCGDILGVAGASLPLYFYDNDKNFISRASVNNDTFTTPNNACFVRFRTGTDFPHPNAYQHDISINSPSTDTTYHAYNGQTYTVNFGHTVYGGVLDVTRGKLKVDMYHFTTDFTGASDIGGGFYRKAISIPYNAVYPAVKPQLCNVAPYQASYSGQFTHFYCNRDTAIIILPDNTPTSTEIEIVYELATPFDIDLTPVQIEQLLGKNNVWHDANGDTEVKYLYNA